MSSDARQNAANTRGTSPENSNAGLKATSSSPDQSEAVAGQESEERMTRLMLYRRDDVRRLVGWVLKHNEIRPQRSSQTGQYEYLGTEFGLGDVSALLTELASHKIFLRTVADTVPSCPACQRSNFHVIYACPYSQHTTLDHGTIIEHYACGNADFENAYRSGPNELVCPKCRRTLKVIGTDYRKVERAYRCSGCGRYFGTPKLILQCRNCSRRSDEEELVMAPVYVFKINEQLRSELISHCSLEASVILTFEKEGFKVTAPIKKQGLSGVLHNFDLEAVKGNQTIVLDMVSATDEVGPRDVIAFFAKVYDTKPPRALLVAMPKLSREAQRLGAMYGVDIIGASSPDEVITRLASIVGAFPGIGAPAGPQPYPSIPIETRADYTVAKPEQRPTDQPEVARSLEESRTTPQTPILEAISTEEENVLHRARERMKHLMKEADDALA